MSDTMTVTASSLTAADEALSAAEAQITVRAQRRAAARMALDKARREYFEEREIERLKDAAAQMRARLAGEVEIPEERLREIIELHANGEPLKSACEAYDVSRPSFYRRVQESDALRDSLALAREASAHAKVDDVYWIARTEPDVERAKLLADIARWEVSKVLPHLYGDKLKLEGGEGVVFSLNIGQLAEPKGESGK
jgi:hypothetical protein